MWGAVLVIVCFVLPAGLTAQESADTGALRGRVTDQTGSVIVGASVTATSRLGKTWTVKTNPQGEYVLDKLPPQTYAVVVGSPGFMDLTKEVTVRRGTAIEFNATLTVALEVSLEVRDPVGSFVSIDPRKNLSALLLTKREIQALPDNPDLFLLRLLEMAGSTGPAGDVAVYVDGFRAFRRLPPKSTIEMVRINSNPFSAEFAQPGLRRIEIVTKAGSDTFHGELRMQARSGRIDGKSPLSDTTQSSEYRSGNGFLQGPIASSSVGFLLYGGRWNEDNNAFINATVLGANGNIQPISTTAVTPATVTSAVIKSDFQLSGETINVSYQNTIDRRRNQGLGSGFDLPEHAYDWSSSSQIGRLWWTSLGRRTMNDLRVEGTWTDTDSMPRVTTPAILVFDAFNAGGNQDSPSSRLDRNIQVGDTVTVLSGAHLVKAGALFEQAAQRSTDLSGFGGTYIFGADIERDGTGRPVLSTEGLVRPIAPIENYRRTVLGLPGYTPSQFSIVRGNPNVEVDQWNLGWFLLDDWTISKRFGLSYGVRQEFQNNISPRADVIAPRASLSWLLDENGKTAIKFGTGIFFSRVEPEITMYTRKLDGVHRQQYVVARPSFFGLSAAPPDIANAVQSSVYVKASDLRVPASRSASVSYERALPRHLFAIVQFQGARGVRQLRLRNISGDGLRTSTANGPILAFESTGRSSRRELMLGLRGFFSSGFSLFANYTFSRRNNDTDGPFSVPADSQNLDAEYGRAADDQPHLFLAGLNTQFPNGWLFDASVSLASGRPFNITTGRDNNADTLFTDRPTFARPGDDGAVATPFGLLNPNPLPGEIVIPRNFGRDPMLRNITVALSKIFAKRVIVSVDVENLLNSNRLFASNGVVTSPVFNLPSQALNPRRLELSVRYGF